MTAATDFYLDFGPLGVTITASGGALCHWLQERLPVGELGATGTAQGQKTCRIEIISTNPALDNRSPQGVMTHMRINQAPVWMQNSMLSCAHADFAMQYDLDRAQLSLSVSPSLYEDGERLWEDILSPLLIIILPFHGLDMIHGAVLTRPDAKTVMLYDRQKAGKTTLAFELMRNGYLLVSDDMPLVTFEGEKTWVRSAFQIRPVNVTQQTLDRYPEYQPFVTQTIGSDKVFLATDDLRKSGKIWDKPVTLTDFIVVYRSQKTTPAQLVPLDQMTVLEMLLTQAMPYTSEGPIPKALKTISEQRMNLLQGLLNHANLYRLEFSFDTIEEAGRLLASERGGV